MPHHDRGDAGAQHEGRHDHGLDVPDGVFQRTGIARRRQQPPLNRHQHDQHDAQPEVGDRDAGQCHHVGPDIPAAALADRRDDAGRDADRQGDDHRHDAELKRHRQLGQDQLRHRHLAADGDPHVARQHAGQPVPVLDHDRVVQVVFLADERQHLGRPLIPGDGERRIAGKQELKREDQQRDQQQGRDADGKAPRHKGQHGGGPSSTENGRYGRRYLETDTPSRRIMPSGCGLKPLTLDDSAQNQF